MITIVSEHLVESTLFCVFLSVISFVCCQRAATRHAILLVSVAKFAVPSVLLAPAGAKLANLWPGSSWMASWAATLIGFLSLLLDRLLFRMEHLSPWMLGFLFAGWIFGTAAVLGVWITKLARRDLAIETPDEAEQAMLDEAVEMAGTRSRIALRSSNQWIGPALSGLYRPSIIIPRNLHRNLSPAEFKAVLLHEIAHARRFDNLAACFVHAIVCLFWFHPLLWLVERQMARERERACDEMVILSGALPRAYASAILKVCKSRVSASATGLNHMAADDLKHRLEFILNCRPPKRISYLPRVVSASLIALMAVVSVAGGYCKQCVSTGQNEPKQFIKRGVE